MTFTLKCNATGILSDMYKEKESLDFGALESSDAVATGHFTQIVWKGSNQLGVGSAKMGNGSLKVVYKYAQVFSL